jgi:hypothetical protein
MQMEGLFWTAAVLFALSFKGRRFLGFHIKLIRAQTEPKRRLPYFSTKTRFTLQVGTNETA